MLDPVWIADVEAMVAGGDGAAVRAACAALATTLPVQHIPREGRPYLERYTLDAGRRNGSRLYLHHFVAGDGVGLLHSHPWDRSRSAILAGGYLEHRWGAPPVEHRPGATNVLLASTYHRVELLEQDAWTLFRTGAVCGSWGFLDAATGQQMHHRDVAR